MTSRDTVFPHFSSGTFGFFARNIFWDIISKRISHICLIFREIAGLITGRRQADAAVFKDRIAPAWFAIQP